MLVDASHQSITNSTKYLRLLGLYINQTSTSTGRFTQFSHLISITRFLNPSPSPVYLHYQSNNRKGNPWGENFASANKGNKVPSHPSTFIIFIGVFAIATDSTPLHMNPTSSNTYIWNLPYLNILLLLRHRHHASLTPPSSPTTTLLQQCHKDNHNDANYLNNWNK